MRNQCSPSALTAIEACVLRSSGCSPRAFRHTSQPQFHCGTPPPAAAPRTTTRSMIRLLEMQSEIPKLSDSKSFEGGHQHAHEPAIGIVVTPGGPPKSKREAVAPAYLRVAHIYMLISMPTGTSTIFGVFQAILALLGYRTNFALGR